MKWKTKKAPTRTLDDVNREYSNLCVQSGDLAHKVSVLSSTIEKNERRMRELDQEAEKLQLEAAQKKQATSKMVSNASGNFEGANEVNQ